MAKTQKIKFLDYEIKNTGNGDGWVLLKPNTTYDNLWECHLGNFSDPETAKKWAVWNFMIARPAIFHACITYRLSSAGGAYREFGLFEECCKRESIEIPEEISGTNDINNMIAFKGEQV